MITLEELKLQFRTQTVSPYGDCIVIPKLSWNEKWYEALEAQNCEVIIDEEHAPNKVLVRQKPDASPGPQQSAVERKGNMPRWLKKDENRLVRRMDELGEGSVDERCALIASEFPRRKLKAIIQKYNRLSALKGKRKRSSAQPKLEPESGAKHEAKPEPEPATGISPFANFIDALVKQGFTATVTITLTSKQVV